MLIKLLKIWTINLIIDENSIRDSKKFIFMPFYEKLINISDEFLINTEKMLIITNTYCDDNWFILNIFSVFPVCLEEIFGKNYYYYLRLNL